jgi:hypothetical protein
MPAAPQLELMRPRALRRHCLRHQRSGRTGRHEPGPDDTTGLVNGQMTPAESRVQRRRLAP